MKFIRRIYYRLIMIEAKAEQETLMYRWARFNLYKNRRK